MAFSCKDYLGNVGFTTESLEEGTRLYEIARKAYNEALSTKDRRYEMHKVFSEKMAVLDDKFNVDWKKAKIVFKEDPVAQEKLSLHSSYYNSYVKWIELARKFYTELSINPDLTEQLSKHNYSSEDTNAGLAAISEIEAARAGYIYEKGISQDATSAKTKAFEVQAD